MSMCRYAYKGDCLQKHPIPLELELRKVIRLPDVDTRTKLRSSGRALCVGLKDFFLNGTSFYLIFKIFSTRC